MLDLPVTGITTFYQLNLARDPMSIANKSTNVAEPSFIRDVVNLGRYYFSNAINWARPYLGGRRGLILLAVAILGVGSALNWGWLVAVGIAPLLITLAPCAVMCAIGVCCMKGGGKSCSSGDKSTKGSSETTVSTKPREEV